MNIHEYQAKGILRELGAPTPRSVIARTPDEAVAGWKSLGVAKVVVKAQIHAGGRGKGGGVKLASSEAETREVAGKIIGMNLVTHQTGPEGKKVNLVLIEEAVEMKKELYAAITLDRATRAPAMMVSKSGGMDIEEVAHKTPEAIHREPIHPLIGLQPHQARRLAFLLDVPAKGVGDCAKILTALSRVFFERDASLVEINPLAILADGRVVAADAKINFDDSALYRHPKIAELRDESEEESAEREARIADLSYVKLDGTIGCMVNGAGLAMATMDIIKHFGGEPANFLDVGGGAKRERVTKALKIILNDPNVKGIFINIFGGIVRCDEVAHGIIGAKQELAIKVPITIRLTGTNEAEGKKILEEAGMNVGTGLKEAAKKAVESIR